MLIPIKVAESFFAVTGALPINVKCMFEGEEEIGSPSLDAFIRENKELLAADVVLSADGAMWRINEPSLTVASRGLAGLELTLTAASKDLHSGRHGGGVANPLHAMARLIASLHDAERPRRGRRILRRRARAHDARARRDRRAAVRRGGLSRAGRRAGGVRRAGIHDARTAVDATDARGQRHVGRLRGPGQKTVIPTEAHAKITCRLVPDQDPDDVVALVVRHLETHVPPGTRLSISAERSRRARRRTFARITSRSWRPRRRCTPSMVCAR